MNNEGAPSVDERMEQLRAQFALQKFDPQGEDPYIAACNESMQQIFVREEHFYKICLRAFEQRTDLSALHANRLAVRAFQRAALHRKGLPHYPTDKFLESDGWMEHQTAVLDNLVTRRRFQDDMLRNSVQTNYDERGKSLKLLGLLLPRRFDRPLRILELGSGPNHNLKKLALNSIGAGYPYNAVSVKRPKNGNLLGSTETDDDQEATVKLNTLLSATGGLALRQLVGLDKDSFRHPSAIDWIRSQFYPSEYKDPAFLEKFDLLQASRPSHVKFRQLDILELEKSPELIASLKRGGPYDMVFYGTFLYQLTAEGREAAERVGDQLVCQDDGIKVYQDFIDVDPLDPSKLILEPHWGPYTYRTIVEDMRNVGIKQTLFVWRRGRCDELQIGPAELCVEDRPVKAEELLAA